MTTSTITLPARAMADTIHRALSVMGREDPHPLLEYAHFWTQDGHLLMEASDQLRLLRTRTAAVSEDAVDVLVMTSNHVSSTAWSPSLIAPLISAVATSEHVIADFREKTTLLTISDHSIALICALQYTASDLPKAAELWPDLLEETSR